MEQVGAGVAGERDIGSGTLDAAGARLLGIQGGIAIRRGGGEGEGTVVSLAGLVTGDGVAADMAVGGGDEGGFHLDAPEGRPAGPNAAVRLHAEVEALLAHVDVLVDVEGQHTVGACLADGGHGAGYVEL